MGKQNIEAKEVYTLKPVGNSIKVLARAMLKKVVLLIGPCSLLAPIGSCFTEPVDERVTVLAQDD